jgi:NADH-quinone oxidoreductase subunit J
MLDAILFYVFAAVAVASALGVVGQRNPTYSAFSLIATLCSLSAIYGLLGSPFIAVLQILVYAGAIMVLFLFVIMLLNVKREADVDGGAPVLKTVALGLALLLALQLGAVVAAHTGPVPPPQVYEASTRAVAALLFSHRFLYVFEATSILILAALVGAITLAKKDL